MTYAAQETSQQSGQPIELYDLRQGTESFQWTTNPVAVVYSSITYLPLEVRRTPLRFSPDERAEGLQIDVPSNTDFVRKYINSVPGQRATLTIRRVHRNDGANQEVQLFKGSVKTITFTNKGLQAEITVLPLTADLADAIPRFVFSGACNHVLYDAACTIASSLFRHENDITNVSADTLTVQGLNAKGDGWATGGYVLLPGGDSRFIIEHVGDVIRVMIPFPTSPLGMTVEVFAGCDKSVTTCATKFVNVTNFGGYPWVPKQNPFQAGLDKLS